MLTIASILSSTANKSILITGCDTFCGYSIALEMLRHKGKTFSDVYVTCYKETQLVQVLKNKGAVAICLAATDRNAIMSAYRKATIVIVMPAVTDEHFMNGGTEVMVDMAGEAGVSGMVVCTKLDMEKLQGLPSLKHIKAYEDAYERTKGRVKYASLVRLPVHMDLLWLIRQQIAMENKIRLPVSPDAKFTAIADADGGRALYNMMIDEKIKPGMYDVTGTELLTFNQVAQIACKVFGKDIKFEKDNGQELTEYLRQHGDVCNNEIALIIDILEAVSRGWLSMKTDTLKRMLGREPMTFSSYLEHNADDFQPKADSD